MPQERTAVKEVLANGATVYVQRVLDATRVSVVVASVSHGPGESADSHGLRHLAEHFVAKGFDRRLDRMVEGVGSVLLAETSRDAVTFQITASKESLPVGIKAIESLVQDDTVTQEEVAKEVGVIREELALRDWTAPLVADVWRRAYGQEALDPFGDIAKLGQLNVETVNSAISRLKDPASLSITVCGDLDAEAVARQVREIVSSLKRSPAQTPWERTAVQEPVRAGSADGEAVALPVPAFPGPSTIATLAAAFGVRAWTAGSVVLYNPSPRAGIVTVALPSEKSWTTAVGALTGRELAVASTGLLVARTWLAEVAADPAKLSKLSAVMLPLNPSFDPTAVSSLADQVGVEAVKQEVVRMVKAASGAGQ